MITDIQSIKEFAKAIRRTAVQMAFNTNTSIQEGHYLKQILLLYSIQE